MIVPDSSAWIEYLRRTGHPVARTLRSLLDQSAELAVTEHIVFEVLVGARSQRDLFSLRSQLLAFPVLPLEGMADYEEAARLYRHCRAAGETVRELTDLLIAIPVIRAEAELLHNDFDFDVIARHSDLKIYSGIV